MNDSAHPGSVIAPVILSGGAGTRLWPLSRPGAPKQFLSLDPASPAPPAHGDGPSDSMLAATARRVSGPGFAPPIVIANEAHRFLVAEALRAEGIGSRAILLEPEGRNTAAAAAVAAVAVAAQDPSALVLLLPSDHVVADVAAFHAAVETAAEAARAGRIVTFGVRPTRPDTGYGYIEAGAPLAAEEGGPETCAIARFVEKPDAERAAAFLETGRFSWNAGMFLFRADVALAEFERHAPKILAAARAAFDVGRVDLDFLRLEPAAFASAPSAPFDVAVMEKTDRGAVLPADLGWSDVGSWRALRDLAARDAEGNAVRGAEAVEALDSRDNLIWGANGQTFGLIGVSDLAIVAADNTVMVAAMARVDEVKAVAAALSRDGGAHDGADATVHRPWGSFRTVVAGPNYKVKRIVVRPGGRLSLQYHHHRAEHWVVVSGVATVTRGDEVFALETNQSTYIPLGEKHRLENLGDGPLVMIEVQTGETLDETDIVRLEDVYGRAPDLAGEPSG